VTRSLEAHASDAKATLEKAFRSGDWRNEGIF